MKELNKSYIIVGRLSINPVDRRRYDQRDPFTIGIIFHLTSRC